MIHQLNMYGKDKVQVAIDRLRTFEPPEGYYLAFSGGKDSVVIKALADMAGVKYDAHYTVTSVCLRHGNYSKVDCFLNGPTLMR